MSSLNWLMQNIRGLGAYKTKKMIMEKYLIYFNIFGLDYSNNSYIIYVKI